METTSTTEIVRGMKSSGSAAVGVQTQRSAPWMLRIEDHPAWETLSQMRMTMRAEAHLNRFKVRDLLALTEGQVFETLSPNTEDVPIKMGSTQLGWGEFEVVEQRMALRVTRLA